MAQDYIIMKSDDGEEIRFELLEQTMIAGKNYILVTDAAEEEDGECYILRDTSEPTEQEAKYEFVEDEAELNAVFSVFEQLLCEEGIDLEQ